MKIFEVIQPRQQLDEGGDSGGVRYNSELGLLLAFCNSSAKLFDPHNPEKSIPATMLLDPKKTYDDIKKLVPKYYEPERLAWWVEHGKNVVRPIVVAKLIELNERVEQFNWAGGKNQNPETSADVEFVGSTISGCSVKEDSGITLNNPTPKDLGINNEGDMFLQYAANEYKNWKKGTFEMVLAEAKANPGKHIGGKQPNKYYVVYDPKTKLYKCVGKNTFEGTAEEVIAKSSTNAKWQRGIGDWFVVNYKVPAVKALMTPLQNSISKQFSKMIKSHLATDNAAAKLLKFVKRPFFYVNPAHVYYVPSIDDVADLTLKDVIPGNADGATIKFFAKVGMRDSEEDATVEIHVRYANGMFEENPTARVQSLKNPQFLSWEELA